MDEVINVGMNKINKTPEVVKATANSSLKGNKKSKHASESVAQFIFLICAIVAILAVCSITIYMFIKGTESLKSVGIADLLFKTVWAPTATPPAYGIVYIILSSIAGTTLAILLGVPIGLLTAVFLTEIAGKKLAAVVQPAVELLAAIPSVIYGLLGLMLLNPLLYKLEKHVFANSTTHQYTGGANLLAAVLVLGIFTGCGNKGNKETESQTDEKATESVNSAENNTEDSTQSSTENQNVADTEQLTTENGQESSVLACPSVNGKLHVEGSKLVDQNNNEVQLRGVSTHGLAWYPQYVTNDCFATLKSFGANVVRLAMYTYESGGYCTDGDRQQLETLVQNGVQYALNNDMYVIIDWHVLNEGNPNRYSDVAKTFFAKMAQQYASYNNVIYEICNEPCKGATWGDVKFYASEVIPSIRSYDKDAVILIGTPNWSQDVDEAVKDPVTGYDNIMYTLHFYAETHKEDLQNKLKSAADAGLPIFVSEFGICSADGNGQVDIDSANSWISLLDSYGISYVCWNLSNKDEKSALLTPACDKTSGFTYEDLSDEGKWLYGVLTSHVTQ